MSSPWQCINLTMLLVMVVWCSRDAHSKCITPSSILSCMILSISSSFLLDSGHILDKMELTTVWAEFQSAAVIFLQGRIHMMTGWVDYPKISTSPTSLSRLKTSNSKYVSKVNNEILYFPNLITFPLFSLYYSSNIIVAMIILKSYSSYGVFISSLFAPLEETK